MDLEELIEHKEDIVEVDCVTNIKDFLLTKLGINRRIQGLLAVAGARPEGYLRVSIYGDDSLPYDFIILKEGYTARKANTGIRGERLIYRPDGEPVYYERNGKMYQSTISGRPILGANKIKILRCNHKD